MKSLLAVARLLTRQKLRKLDVLTDEVLESKSSKFRVLYDALQTGSVRNDREAAKLLYDASPTDARYRQLKSRFRKRLLNTIFFVDQNRPHRSAYDHTYHNCQREWAMVNILRANEAEAPALATAKSLLTTCQHYGFAQLTAECASLLANAAAAEGDERAALALSDQAAEAAEAYRTELRSAAALRQLRLLVHAAHKTPGQLPKRVDIDAAGAALHKLEGLTAERSALRYDAYEGASLLAGLLDEPRSIIKAVEAAALYAEQSPKLMQERRMRALRMEQLAAQVKLNDFKGGEVTVGATEQHCPIGSDAWHRLQRMHASLLLACRQPGRAAELATAARSHRSVRHLPATELEAWELTSALAHLAHKAVDPTAPDRIEVDTFVRRDATFGGEHIGLRAWRLLIRAVLLLNTGQTEKLGLTVSELRELSVRKLTESQHPRLTAVAQVLYRLERGGFDQPLDRVGLRYREELQQVSWRPSVAPESFAPIDLDVLLDYFLPRSAPQPSTAKYQTA